MKKRWKSVLCAVLATLMLAGCSQTGGSSSSTGSSSQSDPSVGSSSTGSVAEDGEPAQGDVTFDENGVSPAGQFPIVEDKITFEIRIVEDTINYMQDYYPDIDMCVMPLIYNEEQAATLANTETVVQSYVDEMAAAFITGTSDPEADWDAYLNELSVKGVDQLLEIYQAAYDARS